MTDQEEEKTQFAGFWVRACADFVDSVILDVIAVVVELLALVLIFGFQTRFVNFFQILRTFNGATFLENFNPLFLQVGLVICRGVLSFVYFSILTYHFQTTPGKKCFGIYVVSDRSGVKGVSLRQAIVRYFSYGLSYLLGGFGFIMVGFHPEKRGLHDLIAGTYSVIRRQKE